MNNMSTINRMSKKEFSKYSGIPERTLRNYLNVRYYSDLKKMDYDKRQRILTSKQVKWLINRLIVVSDDEF